MKSRPRCPRCYTELIVKKSQFGAYFVCPNYPNCKGPVAAGKMLPARVEEYASAA